MAATGIGAVSAALRLAMRPSVLGLGRAIAWAAIIFGGGLIAFSMSTHLWLSLGLLVVSGFGLMQTLASCNTVLQTLVEDQKRGRVMSFYTMAFMGNGAVRKPLCRPCWPRESVPRGRCCWAGWGCVMGGAPFCVAASRVAGHHAAHLCPKGHHSRNFDRHPGRDRTRPAARGVALAAEQAGGIVRDRPDRAPREREPVLA